MHTRWIVAEEPGGVPSSIMTRPLTRSGCAAGDSPGVVELLVPVGVLPAGSVVRVAPLVPDAPDGLLGAVWLKAGRSNIAAAAAAIPRVRH